MATRDCLAQIEISCRLNREGNDAVVQYGRRLVRPDNHVQPWSSFVSLLSCLLFLISFVPRYDKPLSIQVPDSSVDTAVFLFSQIAIELPVP